MFEGFMIVNHWCQHNSFVRLWTSTKEVLIGTWMCIVCCFPSWFKQKICKGNLLTGRHQTVQCPSAILLSVIMAFHFKFDITTLL